MLRELSTGTAISGTRPSRALLGNQAARDGLLRSAVTATAAAWRLPLVAPLRVPNFALLWSGNAISLAGDQFQLVALAVLALDLTGSTAVLGAVLGVQAVPRALFMLLGGVVVDRFQPRRVMLATNTLQGLLVTSLAVALAVGHLTRWHLFVYAACSGITLAFSVPAASALVPQLVPRERLRSANALNSLNFSLAQAVAAPLAGLIVARLGALPAFVFNAASFLIVAGAIAAIRLPPAQPAHDAQPSNPLRQLLEGIAAARADRVVWLAIIALAIFSLGSGGAMMVGLPALAKLSFGVGNTGVGVLFGAVGIGAAAGAVAMGSLPRLPRQGLFAGAVLLGMGIALGLVGVVPTAAAAVPLLVAAGLLRSATANAFGTIVQARAAEATRGRVMALVWLGVFGFTPLSLAAGGALGAVLGPRILLASGGAMVALAGAYSLTQRDFRQAD